MTVNAFLFYANRRSHRGCRCGRSWAYFAASRRVCGRCRWSCSSRSSTSFRGLHTGRDPDRGAGYRCRRRVSGACGASSTRRSGRVRRRHALEDRRSGRGRHCRGARRDRCARRQRLVRTGISRCWSISSHGALVTVLHYRTPYALVIARRRGGASPLEQVSSSGGAARDEQTLDQHLAAKREREERARRRRDDREQGRRRAAKVDS